MSKKPRPPGALLDVGQLFDEQPAGQPARAPTIRVDPDEELPFDADVATERTIESHKMVGRLLGDYRLLSLRGSGAYADVFVAEHVREGTQVAIKMLKPEVADRESVRRRTKREAEVLGRVRHPNVISAYGDGVAPNGRPYLILELVFGEPLSALLDREGRLGVDRALVIAHQIAEGLAAVHTRGLVHRDLKPANVMLSRAQNKEVAKIIDFATVYLLDPGEETRLTRFHQRVGSPAFMSPEQIRGEDVEPATDLYALGVMMFQMLRGRLPFTGDVEDVLEQHLSHPAPDLGPLGDVDDLIRSMLEKRAELRPRSAQEVADKIDEILNVSLEETSAETRARARARARDREERILRISDPPPGIGEPVPRASEPVVQVVAPARRSTVLWIGATVLIGLSLGVIFTVQSIQPAYVVEAPAPVDQPVPAPAAKATPVVAPQPPAPEPVAAPEPAVAIEPVEKSKKPRKKKPDPAPAPPLMTPSNDLPAIRQAMARLGLQTSDLDLLTRAGMLEDGARWENVIAGRAEGDLSELREKLEDLQLEHRLVTARLQRILSSLRALSNAPDAQDKLQSLEERYFALRKALRPELSVSELQEIMRQAAALEREL